MTHGTKFPVTNELKEAFSKAEKDTRFVIAGINEESLVLIKTLPSQGTPQTDIDGLANQIDANTPCYILFKEKQWGPSNWVFISFIPDSGPVQQRTIYGSAIQHLKSELGNENFGSEKRFSDIKEVNWNTFKGFETSSTDKPWSKREIAQQELNAAENVARNEASSKPLPASGFHTASYPLNDAAKDALSQLQSKSVNWIQLSLDDSRKNMTSVVAKSVNTNELQGLIDTAEPQFYLYNHSGNTLVLIYCCPENAPQKNRMVYSTCKASLAESLKQSGVTIVKKYDIREASEMSESALNEALRSASSSLFKPDEKTAPAKSTTYGSPGVRASFDGSQFTNKPVFNRAGYNQRHSSDGGSAENKAKSGSSNSIKSPAPLAQAMGLGNSNGGSKKNIVLPPRGAYE